MGRKHKYPLPENFEEARALRASGVAPPRPRNEFEKMARAVDTGRYAAGHPVVHTSKTQLAVQHALYFVNAVGMSLNSASKIAAAAYDLKNSDNLRRLMRKALAGPQSTIRQGKASQGPWAGLITPKKLPVFVGVVDMQTKSIAPHTTDLDGLEQLDSMLSMSCCQQFLHK